MNSCSTWLEVAGSGDQEVIEAFAAQGADEAFGDRVGAGCPDGAAEDADVGAVEHGGEGRGELAVAVADQEPELLGAVAEVHEQVAGLLGDPGPGGVSGDPGEVYAAAAVLDHDEHVQAAEQDGVDVGEVDRKDRVACAARNCRQVGLDRRGAGSMPAVVRIFQTVEAATRWPSPTSSPWLRR